MQACKSLFACFGAYITSLFQRHSSLSIGRENLLHNEFGRKLNDTLMTF